MMLYDGLCVTFGFLNVSSIVCGAVVLSSRFDTRCLDAISANLRGDHRGYHKSEHQDIDLLYLRNDYDTSGVVTRPHVHE